MILDPRAFIAAESPGWDELEGMLDRLQRVGERLSLDEVERFHHLYQRAGSALARLGGLSAGAATRERLEQLLARAHAVAATARRPTPFRPLRWFLHDLPRAFQRRVAAFWLVFALTVLGAGAGATLLAVQPHSRYWLLPFGNADRSAAQRVHDEESGQGRHGGDETAFAGFLMTHNIKVSLFSFAMGLTLGVGTLVLVLYNGVILGAICWDYLMDGKAAFLAGWLLPHGSVEIPAILLASQAGLLLGAALVARENGASLRLRVRSAAPDILRLLWGVVVLLVWAGILESFFSQVHEPFIPYWVKWGFGLLQLTALAAFLFWPRGGEDP